MKFLSFSDTACVPEKAGVQCRRNERQIGMEVLDDETKILEDGGKTVDEGYVMYGFGWKEPVLCV